MAMKSHLQMAIENENVKQQQQRKIAIENGNENCPWIKFVINGTGREAI